MHGAESEMWAAAADFDMARTSLALARQAYSQVFPPENLNFSRLDRLAEAIAVSMAFAAYIWFNAHPYVTHAATFNC